MKFLLDCAPPYWTGTLELNLIQLHAIILTIPYCAMSSKSLSSNLFNQRAAEQMYVLHPMYFPYVTLARIKLQATSTLSIYNEKKIHWNIRGVCAAYPSQERMMGIKDLNVNSMKGGILQAIN